MSQSLQQIEYEIALLVRLTTAYSPRLGSLDRSEYLMLSELEIDRPLAINELADKLLLNLSTASRQVATLESKRYVKRFPDKNNGRISLIDLTEDGQEVLKKVQKARYEVYADVLKNWTDTELIHLEKSLVHLNKDFKKWRE